MKNILLLVSVFFFTFSAYAQMQTDQNELSCQIYDLATGQELSVVSTSFDWPVEQLGIQLSYQPLEIYGQLHLEKVNETTYKYSLNFHQVGGETGELYAKAQWPEGWPNDKREINLGAVLIELVGMGDMVRLSCKITPL